MLVLYLPDRPVLYVLTLTFRPAGQGSGGVCTQPEAGPAGG